MPASADLRDWISLLEREGAHERCPRSRRRVSLGLPRFRKQKAAAAKELAESRGAKVAEPPRQPLVGEGSELLGHREALLPESALGRLDLDVQGVREGCAGERDSQR